MNRELGVSRQFPDFRILLGILYEQKISTLIRLSISIALAIGAWKLFQIFSYDSRVSTTAILTLMLIGAVTSSFYRTFYIAHAKSRAYLAALPVNKFFWLYRDTTAVLLLFLTPMLITLAPLLYKDALTLKHAITVFLAYLALLVLLRPVTLYSGKQSVLLTFITSALWAYMLSVVIP